MSILSIILPVFAVILLGYIVRRAIKIDINLLSNLAVYILLPALIIYSLSTRRFDETFIAVAFFALAIMSIIGAVAFIVSYLMGLKKSDSDCLLVTGMFMNTGYIGFPICYLAFGEEGLGYAAIYAVVGTLFISSFGVYVISRRKSATAFLKLPLFYAGIIGLLISIFSIPVPGELMGAIEIVGKAGIPFGLFLLGAQLSTMRINPRLLLLPLLNGAVRILISPLVALFLCVIGGVTGAVAGVIIIQSSMPPAVLNFILSLKYNNDPELFASVVFFSTVLSALSIPVILFFLV